MAPTRPPRPASIRTAPARRALSNVGGGVDFRGQEQLRSVVERALDVSSDEDRVRRHLHGFHSYPARLHPDTARALIEELSEPGQLVLDPFCGSGTVPLEAREAGRLALGSDLNPLSVELTKLKTSFGPPQFRGRWLRAAHSVGKSADKERRERAEAPLPEGVASQELFEPGVLADLARLRRQIEVQQDPRLKSVLRLVLSSILTKVSLKVSDSSGSLQHKHLPSGVAIRLFRDRAQELAGQTREAAERLPDPPLDADIVVSDARQLSFIDDAAVQLIVCSPPYPGVYDYAAHHAERLRWLGFGAAEFEEGEIGARRQLGAMGADAARQLWRQQLGAVLQAFRRVLKPEGRAVLVIADSAVDGEAFYATDEVRAVCPEGLGVIAVGSQRRPQFHRASERAFRNRPKQEHLVVLGAPAVH